VRHVGHLPRTRNRVINLHGAVTQ